jgi:flagella basal body P-ring formation protein FlgA
VNGNRRESFPATVILHQFGEVARAVKDLSREQPVHENLFTWQWQDLADLERGLAIGRSSVTGASLTRNLPAGANLREADLKETPLILAGDPVELQVRRGQVAVTVRAFARQNGCLGQTIPVRSELTGRLVNARVAGPGLVEWRR